MRRNRLGDRVSAGTRLDRGSTWKAGYAGSGRLLTHTIVHSTVDATKGRLPVGLDPVQLHKVADTEHGIVVRGPRVLATLAPFADELAV